MTRAHLVPVYQASNGADVIANVRAVRARLMALDIRARAEGIENYRKPVYTLDDMMAARKRAEAEAARLRQLELNKERSRAIKAMVVSDPAPMARGGLCIYREPIGPSLRGHAPVQFIASLTRFSAHDFLGPWRSEPLTWYRQVAIWLYRNVTPLSLPQIGKLVGGRDHTTVLHAVRQVDGAAARLGLDTSKPFMAARQLIKAIDNGTFGVHSRRKGGSVPSC